MTIYTILYKDNKHVSQYKIFFIMKTKYVTIYIIYITITIYITMYVI